VQGIKQLRQKTQRRHRIQEKQNRVLQIYWIIFCFRKDELDGLGEAVLVLRPKTRFPAAQCSARGAEQHNGVRAPTSHSHIPGVFMVPPPSQTNGDVSSHRAVPDHAHFLCQDLDSAARLAAQPPLADLIETIWVVGGTRVYEVNQPERWASLPQTCYPTFPTLPDFKPALSVTRM